MRIMALNQMPEDTKDPDYHQRVQQTLHSYASPGTAIDLCYPDDHPGAAVNRVMSDQHVHTELHYLVSIPALVRKIVWAQEQGYDAVVQTNAFDPGVEAARLAVAIPVIGLCRSSVTLASTLAERIAITVPFEGYVHHTRRILRTYGLERFVTDVRSLDLPGIPRGAEVGERRAALRAGAITLMRSLIEETRAECIVPLGAAIVPYIVSPTELQQELGVPVLNTTAIGIRLAETCVALGISHSPRTYLPAHLAAGDFDQLAYTRATGGRR